MNTNLGPDHSMGISVETEQKVNYLSLELAHERIRDIERATAHHYRRAKPRRETRTRPFRRLLLILR